MSEVGFVAHADSRERLIERLVAAGIEDDFTPAQRQEGWENVVIETDDRIYRFSKLSPSEFQREVDILEAVAGRLPVDSPVIEQVLHDPDVMIYRKITGAWFEPERYLTWTDAERTALATSIAEALTAFHAFDDLDPKLLADIPHFDDIFAIDRVPRQLPQLAERDRMFVEALLHEWTQPGGNSVLTQDVLLHNDFHLDNAVLDDAGRLSGLWDFSCVAFGRAEYDLRYLHAQVTSHDRPVAASGQYLDLLNRVIDAMEATTGRQLDRQLAVAADRLEALADTETRRWPAVIAFWRGLDGQ